MSDEALLDTGLPLVVGVVVDVHRPDQVNDQVTVGLRPALNQMACADGARVAEMLGG